LKNAKYTEDGYLIVSESDMCPLWEKDTCPCTTGWYPDCYFCRYADFRKVEYRAKMENELVKSKLYSVCHNEKNRKENSEVTK
jgi:hypothetical protein